MLSRGYRWLRDEIAFVLVVLLVLSDVAYLYFFPGHWRRGTALMSIALLGGGVLRLVLPASRVGLLSVRGRWRDALCYLALGGVLLGVAIRLH